MALLQRAPSWCAVFVAILFIQVPGIATQNVLLGNSSFASVHRAAFARNHLLVRFSLPCESANSVSFATSVPFNLTVELLYSDDRRFATDSGGSDCSVLAASLGIVLQGCSLSTDRRRLRVTFNSWLESGAEHTLELRLENLADEGFRWCTDGASEQGRGGIFVKTGGRLNTTRLEVIGSALHRCCRRAPGVCHTFDTFAACEVAKDTLRCIACEPGEENLGCPVTDLRVQGYERLQQGLVCGASADYGNVSDVSVCAAVCNDIENCQGFTILNGGVCILGYQDCCPGEASKKSGDAIAYARIGLCSPESLQWRARISLGWQTLSGDVRHAASVASAVLGRTELQVLPAGRRLANFQVVPLPNLGLLSAGSRTTLELMFKLTPAGADAGQSLLFVPFPVLPWDFGIPAGVPLLATFAESDEWSTRSVSAFQYINVPESFFCKWHRVGGGNGGANSIQCSVMADIRGDLTVQTYSMIVKIPSPRAGGLTVHWALYLDGNESADMMFSDAAIGVEPIGDRLSMVASSLMVPNTQTTIVLSLVLGLWASAADLKVTLPSVVLRSVSYCGPVNGWPFPITGDVSVTGSSCSMVGVTISQPSLEYRLQLAAENRGVMPGYSGSIVLSVEWSGFTRLLSADSSYRLASPMNEVGATAVFNIGQEVGPVVLQFKTSAALNASYEACTQDMVLQLTTRRPDFLVVLSAAGKALSLTPGLADCGEVIVEMHSDGSGGMPAPAGCSWDPMTNVGDRLSISFAVAAGFRGIPWGRKISIALFAEFGTLLHGISTLPAFAVMLLCGRAPIEGANVVLASASSNGPLSLLPRRASSAIMTLRTFSSEERATFRSMQLLVTGLNFASAQLLKCRIAAMPLFGLEFEVDGEGVQATQVMLLGWQNQNAEGDADVTFAGSGYFGAVGAPIALKSMVEVSMPSSLQNNLGALQATLNYRLATGTSSVTTGFAAHPYVYVQFTGRTSVAQFGHVLQLHRTPGVSKWFEWSPALGSARLSPQSLLGGFTNRVDAVLHFGFYAEAGTVVIISTPAGMAVAGHGQTPVAMSFHDANGVRVRYPPLPVNVGGAIVTDSYVELPTSSRLWPNTVYAYSVTVMNPSSLSDNFNWSIAVRLFNSFALPHLQNPQAELTYSVTATEGAFPVAPALRGCSLAPSALTLSVSNSIQVFFSTPLFGEIQKSLTLALSAPQIFKVAEPIVIHSLLNLPPFSSGDDCSVPLPYELRCSATNFSFIPGAAYGFEAGFLNPSRSLIEVNEAHNGDVELHGWKLKLARYGDERASGEVYALCEDIPWEPRNGTQTGYSFPLYMEEIEILFFSVYVEPFELFPWTLTSSASQVVVTFQLTSSELPAATLLRATAPSGWDWQVDHGVDGRASVVSRGATRDLALQVVDRSITWPHRLLLRTTGAMIGGQLYGFVGSIRVPDVEAGDGGFAKAAPNVWVLELRGPDAEPAVLISRTHYEAVARSLPSLQIRLVSHCAVLPSTLERGAPADFLLMFQLATPFSPGAAVQIIFPPGFGLDAATCGSGFQLDIEFPRQLSMSGYVYPPLHPVPADWNCTWWVDPDGAARVLLSNGGSVSLPPRAYLVSLRALMPDTDTEVAKASDGHVWQIATLFPDGTTADAPCVIENPFRLVYPQRSLASGGVLDVRWTSPEAPVMVLFFSSLVTISAPVVFTVRAPFGFRFLSRQCEVHVIVNPGNLPADTTSLATGSMDEFVCFAGGGPGTLPLPSFAPAVPQPAPLLEGVISFHVPRVSLEALKRYAFGVSLQAPFAPPQMNTWYLEVNGNVAMFTGKDLLRVMNPVVSATFPGLAMQTDSLPYNDVTLSFSLSGAVALQAAFLLVQLPETFAHSISAIGNAVCAPFRNFSFHLGGDRCGPSADGNFADDTCSGGQCIHIRPIAVNLNGSEAIWLNKDVQYSFTIRVQNPRTCQGQACQPDWSLTLGIGNSRWTARAPGFELVAGVSDWQIVPAHELSESPVLLSFRMAFSVNLLLRDDVVLTMPDGWTLDPTFCASPLGQAAVSGLKAPPVCAPDQAVLTVYEMDMPPLRQPTLEFALAAFSPALDTWQAGRAEWLRFLGLDTSAEPPSSAPLPLEFAVQIRRAEETTSGTTVTSSTFVAAAAKIQAYSPQANMASSFQLQLSNTQLSQRAALRISFVPSASVNVRSNSIALRSSLPFDFSGCELLWEEPVDRLAVRPSDPAYEFVGKPRCDGGPQYATLYAVLLDTSYKARVTMYIANFSAPPPPYAATSSTWEISLQRVRGALDPVILDKALGVEGPGAFGAIEELLPTLPQLETTSTVAETDSSTYVDGNGAIRGLSFASNLALGAINKLTWRFLVAVPVLASASVRMIAPPGFTILTSTFHGGSRHFPSSAAASDVMLTQRRVHAMPGYELLPASFSSMDILFVRVQADSLLGEELSFEVSVQNPSTTLPAEALPHNRWILETLDLASDMVVNSNRMTWRSFLPMPALTINSLMPIDSFRARVATRVDVVCTALGDVLLPAPPAQLLLEITAPATYKLSNDCFSWDGAPTMPENRSSTGIAKMPTAETCLGVGQLASIKGAALPKWRTWATGTAYAITLSLTNGEALAGDERLYWNVVLFALLSDGAMSATPQVSTNVVVIGPAQAAVSTRVRLWVPEPEIVPWLPDAPTPAPLPGFATLNAGDRLLVIDSSWAEAKSMRMSADEVAVLLADGRSGVAVAAAIRNAPADDAAPPEQLQGGREQLVRNAAVLGYILEGLSAAIGYGTFMPSFGGNFPMYMVATIELPVKTGLRATALRIAAPPNFRLACDQVHASFSPNSKSAPSESSSNGPSANSIASSGCRILQDVFATTIVFALDDTATDSTGGHPAGRQWWFSAPMVMEAPSGWPAERKDWEAELVGAAGELRLGVTPVVRSPYVDPDSVLLYFRVRATETGDKSDAYIRVEFAVRAFENEDSAAYASRLGDDAVQDQGDATALVFRLRGPRRVPLARTLWSEGVCQRVEEDMLFPTDKHVGGIPAECTQVQFVRALGSGDRKPASGVLPVRFEFSFQVDITLVDDCRAPRPPCADFFAVGIGDEVLYSRDNKIAWQLEKGQRLQESAARTFDGDGGFSMAFVIASFFAFHLPVSQKTVA